MGKQRWEESEKKREDQRREKVRKRKIKVREKVAKLRFTLCFFQWFVAPEGRKVGSLKRRVQSRLGRWEMKNCTPLLRKAHLVVARSTFPSQNVQSTPHAWTTFEGSDVVLRGKRKRFCTLPNVSKTWRFCCSFNYNHDTTRHYTPLHYSFTTTLHHNYTYN